MPGLATPDGRMPTMTYYSPWSPRLAECEEREQRCRARLLEDFFDGCDELTEELLAAVEAAVTYSSEQQQSWFPQPILAHTHLSPPLGVGMRPPPPDGEGTADDALDVDEGGMALSNDTFGAYASSESALYPPGSSAATPHHAALQARTAVPPHDLAALSR